MKKIIILSGIVALSALSGFAQPTQSGSILTPGVHDDFYTREHLINRKPIPYVSIREADVMWQKRIWRVIDLREKINHSLYYPIDRTSNRVALFDVIKQGIFSRQLEAYKGDLGSAGADVHFADPKTLMTFAESVNALTEQLLMKDSLGNPMGDSIGNPVYKPDTLNPDDIKQYFIKEDWFFDKQRSIMDVRILGIAPIIETTDEAGQFKSYKVTFWLYYPACRNYFTNYYCYNSYNDAEWRTYDEIFHKRLFNSYVYKETNVYDRTISVYAQGIDNLLEAEKIKDDIFKFEHDMWNF